MIDPVSVEIAVWTVVAVSLGLIVGAVLEWTGGWVKRAIARRFGRR